jgi:hypothetical protein
MGLFRRVSLIAGMSVAALGIGAGVAFAAGNESVVSGTTDHTVYKFGQTVIITGTINGDIFCAGQTVTIDAVVNGDVICAGQSLTVDGTIRGNVRVAGQTVNIGANIERSASLAAQDATLQSNAKVGSDVGVAAQTATIDGVVGRDVRSGTNTLVLNNIVGRNVEANAQKLEQGSAAKIGGHLTFRKAAPRHPGQRIAHLWVIRSLYVDLALLVFSLVLVALFPQLFGRWNKTATAKPWLALLGGFLATFVVPVLAITLALTLVGAPLAAFVGLAWLLLLFLSAPVAAFYIGSLILRQEKRAPLIMLAGAVVLGLVCLVPILGGLVTVAAIWFGAGTLLLHLRSLYKKPQYKV